MATLTGANVFRLSAVLLVYLLQLPQVSAKPTVGFMSASSNESETSGVISINIERTVQTNIPTTVTIDLSGTATKDSDYVVTSSLVVTFPANDVTIKMISLFIANDQVVESGERENIILTIRDDAAAFNTKIGYSSHTVYIEDDDVSINCQNTQVTESTGSAKINITRSGSSQALNATHSIGCFTRDNSAVTPSDYTTTDTIINFSSPNQEQQMSITIINDAHVEVNEALKVRCYTYDARVQIQSSCKDAVVTIQNDDTNAYLCSYPFIIRENIGSFSVDICRVGVLSTSINLTLCRTSEGGRIPSVPTGCADVAFTAHSNRITSSSISVIDDTQGEIEEKSFHLYLRSHDSNVHIINGPHWPRIHDDDQTFYMRLVTKIQMTEGIGPADVNVDIVRVGETSVASSVKLELMFTANAESADCTGPTSRVIEFNGGVENRIITVCTVVDDRLVEDDETFNIRLSGVGTSNVWSGGSNRTVNLISNDVIVACQGSSLKEASGTATLRLDRKGATALIANNISCSISNGTAFSPTDYQSQNASIVSFAIDETTKSIPFVIHNDNVAEKNESFTVTCSTSDPRVVVDPSCIGAQIKIINDDTHVYFCPGYSTDEYVGYAVRLCRFGVLEDIHTVRLCILPDLSSLSSVCDDIVFTAYDEVKELVIPVTNHQLRDIKQAKFTISMSTADARVTFNDKISYGVTIHKIDDIVFSLTEVSKELQITEGVPSANEVRLTIKRNGRTSVAAKVSLNLKFTATAGSADCTGSSSQLIQFNAEETSKTITACTVVDDKLVEDDETFSVTITGVLPSKVRTGKSERIIKLISDDVNVKCQGASLKEADGPAIVRMDRTGATAVTANDIMCSTANGTAFSPTDYQSQTSTSVSFARNQLSKNIAVVVKNDNVAESKESFTVTCSTSDPRVVVDPSCNAVQINIINDDTHVHFCSGYSTSIEENVGSYTVRLCRVGVLEANHTVRLCRTSDAVSLPQDYPSVQGNCSDVVFTAHDTVKELVIPVTNDAWGEQEYKTFNISMSTTDPHFIFNGPTSYVVTIRDDDNTFYLTNTAGVELTEGVGSPKIILTINRVGRTSMPSSVSLKFIYTAPAESADCIPPSSPVIQFGAGVKNRTITACTVEDDRLVEDDETFNVRISGTGSSNVRPAKFERTVKLISDDVKVKCHGASLKEADGPAIVTLDRTGATAITANYIVCSTADGTASSLTDYQSQTSARISFALNDLTNNFPVVLTDDRVVERNEIFTVTCTISDPRVVVDSSCIGIEINIINDDTYVYFCPGYSTSIEENVGSYTVRLCRVGVLEDTHTVRLCRTSDEVSLPNDYPAVQAQCDDIVFTAYDKVKELVIPVTNDTWGEQEYKTFNISMNTTDPHVTFNDTTSYVVTIHDDDNTFCFTRTSPTVSEEHDKFVNLTIRRTGEIIMSNASVIINTSPQTAITPEDYTEPILNQRLTFYTGEIEKNISVNIVNDKLVEDDQTFQFFLTGVNGSTVFPECKTSTVTIVSNEVNIFCRDRRGFQSVYENKGPVLMEFTREGSLQYNHTMRIRTIDGSAKSGEDYAAIDKTLTFAPYQTSIQENIVLVNDNVLEPDETFRLSVTSSDDRVYMICPGTDFTILNDDTFIRCANQSIEVSEGKKTVNFTLKREGVLNKASPIWFKTKDRTDLDNSDYKPQSKVNKTFLPGQVYMTLSVGLVDDEYKEDSENFSVIIGSYVPTTLTSGDKCTLITIEDDDPDRITKQQAQALLVGRHILIIVFGVALAFMILVVILVIFFFRYFLRLRKEDRRR